MSGYQRVKSVLSDVEVGAGLNDGVQRGRVDALTKSVTEEERRSSAAADAVARERLAHQRTQQHD